ncbi:MAG: NAD(P)-binding protein [Candidatus Micrarchaeota archaeon]
MKEEACCECAFIANFQSSGVVVIINDFSLFLPVVNVETREERIRGEARKLLLGLLIIISALAIFSFIFFEKFQPFDALYETVCSLTLGKCTLSYSFPSKVASLFLALSSWLVFAVLVEFVTGYVVNLELGEKRMKKRIDGMKNHIIVCGFGDLGRTACEIFKHSGEEYVVVDLADKAIGSLKDGNAPYVQGDALMEETLRKAGIQKAKLLVAALNNDSNNVFLVLTAREANKSIKIASRAFSEQSVGKLHGAGADVIVMPEILGGMELAKQALHLNDGSLKAAFGEKIRTAGK